MATKNVNVNNKKSEKATFMKTKIYIILMTLILTIY